MAEIGVRHKVIFASGCLAAALIMAGCTDSEPAAGTTAPTTTHAPGHEESATGSPTANRPADLEILEQGQSYWAVYLVVAAPGDPRLDAAAQKLQSEGYHPTIGDLGCDQGAAEQLTPTPAEGA